MCAYACAGMSAHMHGHVYRCQRGIRIPVTGVTESYELPDVGDETEYRSSTRAVCSVNC